MSIFDMEDFKIYNLNILGISGFISQGQCSQFLINLIFQNNEVLISYTRSIVNIR